MKKVFGIPSWLPDDEPDRTQRAERINRLFKQLNDLWPDIDILVIAQNWQDFEPIETKNKQIILKYEPLGILKARQILREEFLKRDYDYIIMFDDDAIIKCDNDHVHLDYMAEIDKHPNGFCFIHGGKTKYDDYKSAQLNLCAISRFIYEKENIPNLDPQKSEAYEDTVYACLLHYKYSQYEFLPPKGITHTQFKNSKAPVKSTWAGGTEEEKISWGYLMDNTNMLKDYIMANKDLPADYRSRLRKKHKSPEKTYMGRDNTFLYF